MFFKTNGVELEKAIDPRRGWGRMECNFFSEASVTHLVSFPLKSSTRKNLGPSPKFDGLDGQFLPWRMWKLISESFQRGSREDVKKQLMGSGLIQEIVPELAVRLQGPRISWVER